MAYPKATGFIIGLLLVSMFASIFAVFMAAGSNPTGYTGTDSFNISKYNKITELSTQTQDLKNSTLNVKQQADVFDLVGGFFSNAYKVIVSIPQSLDLFSDMSASAVSDAKIGSPIIDTISNTMQLIVVILFIVGILLAALIKWVL